MRIKVRPPDPGRCDDVRRMAISDAATRTSAAAAAREYGIHHNTVRSYLWREKALRGEGYGADASLLLGENWSAIHRFGREVARNSLLGNDG